MKRLFNFSKGAVVNYEVREMVLRYLILSADQNVAIVPGSVQGGKNQGFKQVKVLILVILLVGIFVYLAENYLLFTKEAVKPIYLEQDALAVNAP